MPYKLSPSKIALMQECRRCFWLDVHKEWRRPAGKFPSLPSGMDLILKAHFDRFRDLGILPPELQKLDGSYKLYHDANQLREWRDARRGIRWKYKDGNELCGAIDNLLVKHGKFVILDYKTRGFPLKEDTHQYYRTQLNIYALLFEKNGHDVEHFAYLLFYVPKNVMQTGEVIFDTELIRVSTNSEYAQNIFDKAIQILNGKKPLIKCEWCKFVP